ncbi:MAG: hypothetical protein IJO32_07010 [Bacilli bacterium]|nr:hypothetical protein [Bacilli bacterium]
MFKDKKISQYKEQISKLIVDEEIKNDILDMVSFFTHNGKVKIDGNNLYGKITHQNETDSLIINYDLFKFVFNYVESNVIFRKTINISQEYIKGGNHKITKHEKRDYRCCNNQNKISIEETEKIYNLKNNLVYDSILLKEYDYDTYPEYMKYNSSKNSENSFHLEKKWYIPNGSIIKYILGKNFMKENNKLNEKYYICEKTIS